MTTGRRRRTPMRTKITKMKDGRTHLAHKADHAVDLETGAIVGVTVQDADQGDTTTMVPTVKEAVQHLDEVADANGDPVPLGDEIVADKGCHSRAVLLELRPHFRTYISEPDRRRQSWRDRAAARDAVYANRRRIRGARGRRLLRRRGEYLERTFAHVYDTGGMRRTHLRGHDNILKRVFVHTSGFNLGLLMRRLLGTGTPRGLQGRLVTALLWVIGSCHTMLAGDVTSWLRFVILAGEGLIRRDESGLAKTSTASKGAELAGEAIQTTGRQLERSSVPPAGPEPKNETTRNRHTLFSRVQSESMLIGKKRWLRGPATVNTDRRLHRGGLNCSDYSSGSGGHVGSFADTAASPRVDFRRPRYRPRKTSNQISPPRGWCWVVSSSRTSSASIQTCSHGSGLISSCVQTR